MKLNYRFEINGLRALAVISVVLYNDINFYSDHNHPSQYFINKIVNDIIKV